MCRRTEFLIDANDYNSVSRYRWVIHENGLESRIDGKVITLGAFLIGSEASKKIKRVDSSVLDYRRENLYYGNIYTLKDGYYESKEFSGKIFLIDEADYELCKEHIWHVDKNGYVISKFENGKSIKLHRYLLGVDSKDEVDHIDRDPLNNRRSNLRIADRSLNCKNRGLLKNNKSGFVGVYKNGNSWCAQISSNGVKYYLGCYKSKEEAIQKRREAEKIFIGFEK